MRIQQESGRQGANVIPRAALGSTRSKFDEAWIFPLALFVSTRVALLASSYMGNVLTLGSDSSDSASRCLILRSNPALHSFCCWDCGWFNLIATEGFGTVESAQVFPLLPLLAWLLKISLRIPSPYGLILVANLASLASYCVLFRLFRRLEGTAAARWGLGALVAYPFHFFQAVGYSESLMVFTSALAILFALEGRHVRAGLALGFGVLARHITLFAGPGLLLAQIRERGLRPKPLLLSRGLVGLALPFLFLGAWVVYLHSLFHTWTTLHDARMASWWGRAGRAYWGVLDTVKHIPYQQHPEYYFYLFFAAIPASGAVALFFRQRWAELAWPALVLLVLCYTSGGASLGRYTGSCWPAFLPIGIWLTRKPRLAPILLGGLMLIQGLFFFLHGHGFEVL
ncbi:MAG: hypothetical protein ABSB49_03245 [Polyangia bacterium]